MAEFFGVVGERFFVPLSSQFKKIYVDCLNIIYDLYRTELSYGADRDVMAAKLTDYFENLGLLEIQFEDDQETLKDSRTKATTFLRNEISRKDFKSKVIDLFTEFVNIYTNENCPDGEKWTLYKSAPVTEAV